MCLLFLLVIFVGLLFGDFWWLIVLLNYVYVVWILLLFYVFGLLFGYCVCAG